MADRCRMRLGHRRAGLGFACADGSLCPDDQRHLFSRPLLAAGVQKYVVVDIVFAGETLSGAASK